MMKLSSAGLSDDVDRQAARLRRLATRGRSLPLIRTTIPATCRRGRLIERAAAHEIAVGYQLCDLAGDGPSLSSTPASPADRSSSTLRPPVRRPAHYQCAFGRARQEKREALDHGRFLTAPSAAAADLGSAEPQLVPRASPRQRHRACSLPSAMALSMAAHYPSRSRGAHPPAAISRCHRPVTKRCADRRSITARAP